MDLYERIQQMTNDFVDGLPSPEAKLVYALLSREIQDTYNRLVNAMPGAVGGTPVAAGIFLAEALEHSARKLRVVAGSPPEEILAMNMRAKAVAQSGRNCDCDVCKTRRAMQSQASCDPRPN